jgi:esterase/lipase superfamily enzyme
MNREYHKWFSGRLNRDMELLIFGHTGTPVLVFPTSMGRFFEYSDRGMIDAVSDKIERGELQFFCVDGVDGESWYNKGIHPADRVRRHMQYEDYLVHEVMPFMRQRNWSPQRVATGCSFGGYHCVNFALKHPDLITDCISMGGAFDIKQFLNGYYDDNCYYNNPPDYLHHLRDDDWRRKLYNNFILVTGEHDMCLDENFRLARIMGKKHIPHILDVWANGTAHDWPWWHNMARKFF